MVAPADSTQARIAEAAAFLAADGFGGPYACAVVVGTGLAAVAGALARPHARDYATIPHFPAAGVSGHAGRLVAGDLGGRRVLVFDGRAHAYESGDPGVMRVPVGVAAALGAPTLILTNAAGSTRPATRPGAIVAISDHVMPAGANPLVGARDDRRFVAMTDAYDPGLRALLREAAAEIGAPYEEGVYMWFSGPSFETPAEIRIARLLGADLVGMSTAPETILARHQGLRVVGLSIVTNLAAGVEGAAPSHAETKAVAGAAGARLARLIEAFVSRLPEPTPAPEETRP